MDEIGFRDRAAPGNHVDKRPANGRAPRGDKGWRKVLYDFSQNTTIHGVRQIGEDTPFTIRRFFWLLVVCGGMVAFGYQVVSSVVYYRSWPVTVDVRINYNHTLSFPAVTICNQNAFRVTSAHKNHLYDTINRLYGSRDGSRNDNQLPRHSNMSLLALFNQTAHRKEDLILGCEWGGKKCRGDDFAVTISDFGVCYTFNHGKNGHKIHKASVTGADHGLRLTLNIEQYEYMQGPNSAAGLKLLVHHQDEVPMMRDMGQAIPPGSHALVGVEILQIMNLKSPHGVCDDSKKLKYFERYSLPACHVDCKERWLASRCSCRDIYMASINGYPPVCSLHQFETCMNKAIEEFNGMSEESRCDACPIPCKRRIYEATITYASTSNFDTDSLLRSKNIDYIKDNYLQAQETRQRVNVHTSFEYLLAINRLRHVYENVTLSLSRLKHNIGYFKNRLLSETNTLLPRIWYHHKRGLENVKYIVDHDFIRGFDIIAERALDHVTNGMFEIQSSFDRMHAMSKATPAQPKDSRHIIYLIMDNNLSGKLYLAKRAQVNMTEVHNAYLTGKTLLRFRKTPQRRYDLTYVAIELLRHDVKTQKEYFNHLNITIRNLTETMGTLRSIAHRFYDTGTVDSSKYEHTIYWFIKACKGFNYRRFQIRDKIIYKAGELAGERIANFLKLNETLFETFSATERAVEASEHLLNQYTANTGQRIGYALDEAHMYLSDINRTKLALSQLFNSRNTTDGLRAMRSFFSKIRLRLKDIQDNWKTFEDAFVDIWKSMLSETTTKTFYRAMQSDIDTLTRTVPRLANLSKIIATMSRKPLSSILTMQTPELYALVNADFPRLNMSIEEKEIRTRFQQHVSKVNVNRLLGNRDDQLIELFEEFQSSLASYERKLRIDSAFLRSNLMKVDVFMKELSYQEIEQQKAYGLTNLWSDIGGSIGLFIGASVITVLEVVDVIVHNLLIHQMRRK